MRALAKKTGIPVMACLYLVFIPLIPQTGTTGGKPQLSGKDSAGLSYTLL